MDSVFCDELISNAVVLDNGSGYIKVGLANNQRAPLIVPQLIGHTRGRKVTSPEKETFVGSRAQKMSGVSFISSPSERGIIRSFDDQSTIFEDVLLNQLELDPYDHPFVLSQPPLANSHQEKRLTSELFEKLYVPSLVKKPDSVLSLFDGGYVTGVVVDCGDSISHTSAIYHGSLLMNSVQQLPIGGKDVSEYVSKVVMRESGFYAKSRSAFEHIRSLKEGLQGLCKTFKNRSSSLRKVAAVDYCLPDGQKIQISSEALPELYKATDVFFNPVMIGLNLHGLAEMFLTSIAESNPSLHELLLQQVILSGGSTLLAGFKQRLEKGIFKRCRVKVNIQSATEPQLAVWRGGCILSNLSSFEEMSVKRQEYFEEGVERIEHKFV